MSMIVTDTDSDQLNAVMAGGSFAAPGLREIESRHGVFNVEVLLAERVALSAQLAPLDAVVGPGSVGDAQTKSLLYIIAAEHRERLTTEGRKFTEAVVEEAARGDPRYTAKLAELQTLRAEYVVVRSLIDRLTAMLLWAHTCLRLQASEPKV